MKIKIPSKNYGLTELYDTVAAFMGRDPKDLTYDCRHINVSEGIQNGFFAYYREQNPNADEESFKMWMSMMLLNYGPKVDKQLEADEVEVFDGFIC